MGERVLKVNGILSNDKPIAVDLCCGVGGFSLGIEAAGFEVALAVDIDAVTCQAYQQNFSHTCLLCADLRQLTAVEIKKLLKEHLASRKLPLKEAGIDLVFGSPPCQGFSIKGKRDPADPRNELVGHFVRLVLELAPPVFVMENVSGLSDERYAPLLKPIKNQIETAGYTLQEWELNAADYGVPQRRKRVFWVGVALGRVQISPAAPQNSLVTVKEALADLPDVRDYPHLFITDRIVLSIAAYNKQQELASDPDWFRFHPTNWQGMRQVGNAVPPLLGYSVARAIQPVLTSKVSTVGYVTMEGEESKLAAVVPTKLAVGLHQVEIRLLVPHPCNASIYGEDEDISSLVESIRISGWIKPLVVTPSYIIISGHRRWQAALVLGLETVPVEVREFSSCAAELEALLLENESRHKTVEQKVREANAWRDIESELARMRKLATLKQGEHCPDVQNFAPREELGKTRDHLAKKVGLGSGFTYSKAARVVAILDEEVSFGNREAAIGLRKVLNSQSVDAAYKLANQPPVKRAGVLELIAKGKAKTTKQAEKLLYTTHSSGFERFGIGDWVEVNSRANPHHGERGQVDLLLSGEQQVSVILENIAHSVRFDPQELKAIAKAPPPCPYQAGNLVRINIDPAASIDAATKKYKGMWGIVQEIGELGSVKVDVGCVTLQLLSFDLKPIDNPSPQLRDVAFRLLRLRKLELDEIEEKMLDVLQAREWFTDHQLIHLETIEKLYSKMVVMKRTS